MPAWALGLVLDPAYGYDIVWVRVKLRHREADVIECRASDEHLPEANEGRIGNLAPFVDDWR